MKAKAGKNVGELVSQIKGWDADVKPWIAFMAVSLGFGAGATILAIDLNKSSWGSIVGMSGVAVGIGILLLGIIMAFFIHADPDRFVEAYKRDNRDGDVSDIEIIKTAYSECLPYVNKGLNIALISWLLLGIWTAFIEFGIATGTVVIKNWSLFWLLIFVASIGSLLGFILTVIFFLRKRSIEKALFAI